MALMKLECPLNNGEAIKRNYLRFFRVKCGGLEDILTITRCQAGRNEILKTAKSVC
jgi:hypothetical protein